MAARKSPNKKIPLETARTDEANAAAELNRLIANAALGGLPRVDDAARDAAWRISQASRREARGLGASGDYVGAVHKAFEAASMNAQDDKAWTVLARQAIDAGQVALAEIASRRAVMLSPCSAEAAGARAEALVANGRAEEAIPYLTASIINGGTRPGEASDSVFRCRRHFDNASSAAKFFDTAAEAALDRGKREQAAAAFVKGAAWSRAPDVLSTLLRLAEAGDASGAPRAPASQADPPLVLISQIQRSGGSLLAQLFDGHPEIFAHPHELHIGRPEKWNWPDLDLGKPTRALLEDVFETTFLKFMVRGYSKGDGNAAAAQDFRPFKFSLEELVADFLRRAEGAARQRDIINAYLMAFVTAWAGQPPSGRERYVTAFCPRMISTPGSMPAFFRDYPDGRVLSCIREPSSWYASSHRHDAEYADPIKALSLWRESAVAALALAESNPMSALLLTYEELVSDTAGTIKRVADWLGIEFQPSLLTPTFAGQAVMPNSSFKVEEFGVHVRSLNAPALSDAVADAIRRDAFPLYEKVCSHIAERRAARAFEAGAR